jgi:hypothetical protein
MSGQDDSSSPRRRRADGLLAEEGERESLLDVNRGGSYGAATPPESGSSTKGPLLYAVVLCCANAPSLCSTADSDRDRENGKHVSRKQQLDTLKKRIPYYIPVFEVSQIPACRVPEADISSRHSGFPTTTCACKSTRLLVRRPRLTCTRFARFAGDALAALSVCNSPLKQRRSNADPCQILTSLVLCSSHASSYPNPCRTQLLLPT